jgi:hypothetical protein
LSFKKKVANTVHYLSNRRGILVISGDARKLRGHKRNFSLEIKRQNLKDNRKKKYYMN